MKNRCRNPKNPSFMHYGGRGISVCDRWLEDGGRGFLNFIEDMGPPPTPKHSLDRINVDGNYEPGNVRWANDFEQARNKRGTKMIKLNGIDVSLAEVCEYYRIDYKSAYNRIFRDGMDGEKTIKAMVEDAKRPKQKPAWAL